MTILVTGGAGFIGANFVLHWLAASDDSEFTYHVHDLERYVVVEFDGKLNALSIEEKSK